MEDSHWATHNLLPSQTRPGIAEEGTTALIPSLPAVARTEDPLYPWRWSGGEDAPG